MNTETLWRGGIGPPQGAGACSWEEPALEAKEAILGGKRLNSFQLLIKSDQL